MLQGRWFQPKALEKQAIRLIRPAKRKPDHISNQPTFRCRLLLVSGRAGYLKQHQQAFSYLKIRQIEGLLLLFRLFFRNIVRICASRCVRLNLLNHVRTMGSMILKSASFMNHGWLPNRVRDCHLPWDKDGNTIHKRQEGKRISSMGIYLSWLPPPTATPQQIKQKLKG